MGDRRILIIRFSSIGDIVLTSPLARCLKQQLDAEIHYLTKPEFSSLLRHNPYVDRIITLNPSFKETLSELRSFAYDRVIDLHKNIRSYRVRFHLGVKAQSFPKWNLRKWLHVQFKWDVLPADVHIVDRMFRAVRPLGVTNDGRGLDLFLPPDKTFHRNMEDMLETEYPVWGDGPKQFAVFAIGGAHATKKMPVDRIAAVCNLLPFPVILLGGPGDRTAGKEIMRACKGEVYDSCGALSLLESAALVRLSDIVLSHDTGMMHIAAAFQQPLVSIWGNTVPEFGMYPYYGDAPSKNRTVEQKELSCRPCSKIGYESCPKGHFRCMRDHSPERIARLAGRRVAGTRSTWDQVE